MTEETLIQIKNLYKVFGTAPETVMPMVKAGKSKDEILAETGHTVGLNNINLEIKRGSIFVIMGLSGSGKSTLIRHFNRLIDPTSGSIEVNGVDVMTLSQKELEDFRRHKMSMVFQRFALLPHRTVLENIAYGLAIQGVVKGKRNEKALEWLEAVGLEGYGQQYPAQLSGGQQQRVGLARALCTDPEVLLMDEAFSALDPLIRSGMQDQLIELQDRLHKTIIFITHDLDEALRLGDQIAILKDGVLSQVGKPEEILLNPADAYVEAFVRDVNRARVLTAEVVMQPPALRLTNENLDEALKQMRGVGKDYGYVFNEEDDYEGVVTRQLIEDEIDKPGDSSNLINLAEGTPTVQPTASIEAILPTSLEQAYPVPVICDEGDFLGVVSRKSVVSVLSEAESKDISPAA